MCAEGRRERMTVRLLLLLLLLFWVISSMNAA